MCAIFLVINHHISIWLPQTSGMVWTLQQHSMTCVCLRDSHSQLLLYAIWFEFLFSNWQIYKFLNATMWMCPAWFSMKSIRMLQINEFFCVSRCDQTGDLWIDILTFQCTPFPKLHEYLISSFCQQKPIFEIGNLRVKSLKWAASQLPMQLSIQ